MNLARLFLCVLVITLSSCAIIGNEKDVRLTLDSFKDQFILVSDDQAKVYQDIVSISEDKLTIAGKPKGYIRSIEAYDNYVLSFKWRWANKAGNGGVLIHTSEEDAVWPTNFQVQLKHKHVGDIIAMGDASSPATNGLAKHTLLTKLPEAEKIVGEWNELIVKCNGSDISVVLNDQLVNSISQINKTKGFIGFQLEGVAIEYKDILLVNL